jgi:hypothetical protein
MDINTKELIDILSSAINASSDKKIVEEYGMYLFLKNKIVTQNEDVFFIHKTPFSFKEKMGIFAKELLKLVKSIKSETLQLEQKENSLVLLWEKAKVSIRYFNFEDSIIDEQTGFFVSRKWDKLDVIELPDDFYIKLEKVIVCASTDLMREALCAVHFKDDYIEATDGFCLIRTKFKEQIFENKFLLPVHNAKVLLKNRPKYVLKTEDESRLWFMNEEKTVVQGFRFFESDFVNTEELINNKEENVSVVFNERVKDSLLTAQAVSDSFISIAINNKKIDIMAEQENSTFHEELDLDNVVEDVRFEVLSKYLLRAMGTMKETDEAFLHQRYIRFVSDETVFICTIKV